MLLPVPPLSGAIPISSNREFIISLSPSLWKPWHNFIFLSYSIVRQFLTNVPACMARAEKHLAPYIKERLAKEEEYGTPDWPDKPVSLLVVPCSVQSRSLIAWVVSRMISLHGY